MAKGAGTIFSSRRFSPAVVLLFAVTFFNPGTARAQGPGSVVATIPDIQYVVANSATNRYYAYAVEPRPGAIALSYVNVYDGANDTLLTRIGPTSDSLGQQTRPAAANPVSNLVYLIRQTAYGGSVSGPGAVLVYDGNSHKLVATVSLTSPVALAVDPVNNRYYVVNDPWNGTPTLLVYDGTTNGLLASIPLPVNGTAQSIAVNPSTNRAYIAMSGLNRIMVIDTVSNAVTTTISVPSSIGQVAVNPDTNRLYVAYNNAPSSFVRVIDASSNNTIAELLTGDTTYSVAVNVAANLIYASAGGSLQVIDGGTNSMLGSIVPPPPPRLPPLPPAGQPFAGPIALNPASGRIYVACLEKGPEDTSLPYVSVIQGATPPPPATPSVPPASYPWQGQVNLAWTDNSNDEDGFQVERCEGEGCIEFVRIASVEADVTSYGNTGLTAATTYTYRVRAYNSAGNSAYSNTASVTTPSLTSLLAPPSALTATAVSPSQANLTWADDANSANSRTGFQIERCRGVQCNEFAQVATVGADVLAYSDVGLDGGSEYAYRVRAYNAGGSSAPSDIARASTPQ